MVSLESSPGMAVIDLILSPNRGRGRLKSTMDVISAAKQISETGANLDKFCKQIADQVWIC